MEMLSNWLYNLRMSVYIYLRAILFDADIFKIGIKEIIEIQNESHGCLFI